MNADVVIVGSGVSGLTSASILAKTWNLSSSYAPEFNPDEQVWNYLKNHKIGRQSTKNGWDLFKRVDSVMRSLQKFPEKIKFFFRLPMTKYILMFCYQRTP